MYYNDYKHNDSMQSHVLPAVETKKAHLNTSGHKHYLMRHRSDRIQASLRNFIEPMVAVGFDAQQIQEELHRQGERLVPTGQIESVISIILGEQQ